MHLIKCIKWEKYTKKSRALLWFSTQESSTPPPSVPNSLSVCAFWLHVMIDVIQKHVSHIFLPVICAASSIGCSTQSHRSSLNTEFPFRVLVSSTYLIFLLLSVAQRRCCTRGPFPLIRWGNLAEIQQTSLRWLGNARLFPAARVQNSHVQHAAWQNERGAAGDKSAFIIWKQ